jgi:hypothetical protein
MQPSNSVHSGYEPPTLVLLGSIEELTLGSLSGPPGDGSATYFPESDGRLKSEIRRVPNALERLRRLDQEAAYDPPALVQLGPVEELTLGGQPGGQGDGSATYSVDAG